MPDDLVMLGFHPWSPALQSIRPPGVLADTRVECLTIDGVRARGVAVAFNWQHPGRPRYVFCWRHERPM